GAAAWALGWLGGSEARGALLTRLGDPRLLEFPWGDTLQSVSVGQLAQGSLDRLKITNPAPKKAP
ncbi:MAG: hypothetical protein LDL07_03895, partial [Desulfarculus sp.]|nr:hypothetical protein [Desulfarculus sp.]